MIAFEVGPGGANLWTTTQEEAALAALIAATQPFNGAKLGLYANNFTPTKASAFAAFTPPAFTGYSVSAALTFGTVMVDANGVAVLGSNNVEFKCTAGPASDNVYGAYLIDTTGAIVLDSFRFADGPLAVTATGDSINVIYLLSFEKPLLA